jgi:hypothetical protein
VSAIIFLAAAGFLAVDAWRHRGDAVPATETAPDDEPVDDEPETVVVPEGRDEPPDNSSPDPAAPS